MHTASGPAGRSLRERVKGGRALPLPPALPECTRAFRVPAGARAHTEADFLGCLLGLSPQPSPAETLRSWPGACFTGLAHSLSSGYKAVSRARLRRRGLSRFRLREVE